MIEVGKKIEPNSNPNNVSLDENRNQYYNNDAVGSQEIGNENHCDICIKDFESEGDLVGHRKEEHKDMNYNCKLCDQRFINIEDHLSHRAGASHTLLSKAVANQFMLEVGDACVECRILETSGNRTYHFCENDAHIDTFENIWNNMKLSGSMPVSKELQ